MPAEIVKPCPFCGGHANIVKTGFNIFIWEWLIEYCIRCSVCGAESGAANGYRWQKSRSTAIERWNRRAGTKECACQQPTTAQVSPLLNDKPCFMDLNNPNVFRHRNGIE